jgi:hypothetical protein
MFGKYQFGGGPVFSGRHECLMSMTQFVRDTFQHIHKKKAVHGRVRGADLQQLLVISPYVFHNLFQQEVADYNRENHTMLEDPAMKVLPVLNNLLSWYHMYRLRGKDMDEIFEMDRLGNRFVTTCRTTFEGLTVGTGARTKHICASNKMHRIKHAGEQTLKLGDSRNFGAMAEQNHKLHVKGPQHLTNKADISGPGLLKVFERKDAVRHMLRGWDGNWHVLHM